ncbi:MAG: HNH endonuclease [Nitrospiraceae bacterium]|nr:HNH endonuclease [Nitrospiraceae bacterium]
MVFFAPEATPEEIEKERRKARELRQSGWWKRKRSSGLCHFCGGKFDPRELTMEHVVPLMRGGRSVRGNIVPACKKCNQEKKNLLPVEWEEYLRRLSGPDDDFPGQKP